MKECDIFGVKKHTLTPPTYFRGHDTPTPRIYAPASVTSEVCGSWYFTSASAHGIHQRFASVGRCYVGSAVSLQSATPRPQWWARISKKVKKVKEADLYSAFN